MHKHLNDILLSVRELSEGEARKALGNRNYETLADLDVQDYYGDDLGVVVHEVAGATLEDFLDEMVSVAKPFGIREICCLVQQFYCDLTEEPAVILVSRGSELLLVKVVANSDFDLEVFQPENLDQDTYRVFSIDA